MGQKRKYDKLVRAAQRVVADWNAHSERFPITDLSSCSPYGPAIAWQSLYDLELELKALLMNVKKED